MIRKKPLLSFLMDEVTKRGKIASMIRFYSVECIDFFRTFLLISKHFTQ